MSRFLDALTAFGDRITDVDPRWAAAAMAVQLAKTFVVARAWRSVLTGAYPGTEVRFLRIWGAYLIGVGTNALIPLRGGDAAKVIVAKRQIDGATYATVGSTLLVLALFDILVGGCLFVWANAIGALPSLHLLHRRAFDIDWIYRHPALSGSLATALGVGAVFALGYAWRHVVAFKDHVFQGFRELRSIRHYLLHVVPWQALDWMLRVVTVLLFLRAFGLPGTLHNAGLAQVTQDLSTAIPISPGGSARARRCSSTSSGTSPRRPASLRSVSACRRSCSP